MRKMFEFVLLFVCAICFIGCAQKTEKYWLEIEKQNDTLHCVRLCVDYVITDSLLLPYPVYRFDYADLTGDGVPEVVIGVIKKTRYWKTEDKRIFIYHLFQNRYIRPLWLGSRLGNPIKDFRLMKDSIPAYIRSEEWAEDSTIITRDYILGGFGVKLR